MTMISEKAVANALYTLLNTLTTGSTPSVAIVYDGVPAYPDQFPAISIRPEGWEDTFADMRDTEVAMTFIVTVYVQLAEASLTAQDTLRQVVKAVREILGDQDNMTLGGLVDSSRLTSGTYLFDQKESKLGFCEIRYKVRKRFNRFS